MSQASAAAELNRDPETVAPGGDVGPAGGPAVRAQLEVVVGSRETLGAIARRYGVTLEALCAANGITNPDRVRAGQRLRVPVPGTRSAIRPVHAQPNPALPSPEATPVVSARPEAVRARPEAPSAGRSHPAGMAAAARHVVAIAAEPAPVAASPFDSLTVEDEPTPEREPAQLTVLTDVYGLRELARAPESRGGHISRPAPAAPRPAVGSARFERFGAIMAVSATARRAALDLFAPPPRR